MLCSADNCHGIARLLRSSSGGGLSKPQLNHTNCTVSDLEQYWQSEPWQLENESASVRALRKSPPNATADAVPTARRSDMRPLLDQNLL